MAHPEHNGIKHTATYNFDDALEAACTRKGIAFETFGIKDCIYAESAYARIYHLHGKTSFLNNEETQEDCVNGLIFTEGSYFKRAQNAYSVSNTCHAQLLDSHNCLSIGLSFQDDSLRRLLRNRQDSYEPIQTASNRIKQPRHFILLTVEDIIKSLPLPYWDESEVLSDSARENIERGINSIPEKDIVSGTSGFTAEAAKMILSGIIELRSRYLRKNGFERILAMYSDVLAIVKKLGEEQVRAP